MVSGAQTPSILLLYYWSLHCKRWLFHTQPPWRKKENNKYMSPLPSKIASGWCTPLLHVVKGELLHKSESFKTCSERTPLVVQWLRICLPMQGTRVWALVWEDLTCRGVTKPVRHNYWIGTLEPVSHNYWARVPQLLKPAHPEPVLRNKRSHHNEKPVHCNKEKPLLAATRESPRTARPNTDINK